MARRVVKIGGWMWRPTDALRNTRDYFRELQSGAFVRVLHVDNLPTPHRSCPHCALARKNGAKWFAFYYSRTRDYLKDRDCFTASSTRSAASAVEALHEGMAGRVHEVRP